MAEVPEEMAAAIYAYVKKRIRKEELGDVVRFFCAQVVTPAQNGKITVQRPFDSAISIPYTASAAGLAAGESCLVLVFGNMSNAVAAGSSAAFGVLD